MKKARQRRACATRVVGSALGAFFHALAGLLDRLEERGLLQRQRDDQDRRRQWLLISDAGRELIQQAPSLMPPEFNQRFAVLADWERHSLTAALLRAAELCGEMD